MDRRTFLKITGLGSLSLAAGCTSQPAKFLYSLVHAPEDMVVGEPTWYATTCRECPAGCGVLAKVREDRVIKVEGNPLHPINLGTLCMRGQAALQAVYNPDRIKTPLVKEGKAWRALSYGEARNLLMERFRTASEKGPSRVRLVSEVVGETLLGLMQEAMARAKSSGPLLFEPYAYELQKTANAKVFGVDGLPSYRMEQADLLVSFGADFVETWLSPVEYARKFKEMQAFRNGRKGFFAHVAPYQSLTGANADLWVPCNPDGEWAVVLGLLRECAQKKTGRGLPGPVRALALHVADSFTAGKVREIAGVPPELFEKLTAVLLQARKPLVLGTGTGAAGPHALQTNVGVNLLNLVLDPDLALVDFGARHRVEAAAKRSDFAKLLGELDQGSVDLLLLNNNNVNPVYNLPPSAGVKEALGRDSLFVISFSNFMDETTELADLVLPVRLPLESWDEYAGKGGLVSTLQPAMTGLTGAPYLGDLLLRLAFGAVPPVTDYHAYLFARFRAENKVRDEIGWLEILEHGGSFPASAGPAPQFTGRPAPDLGDMFVSAAGAQSQGELTLIAAPSIRFFDGRGANRPWLAEVPDALDQVAWQTPVSANPATLAKLGLGSGDLVEIESKWGKLEAPAYEAPWVKPGLLVMAIGQGHTTYGRYALGKGVNPILLLSPELGSAGGPAFAVSLAAVKGTGRSQALAHIDGSRTQHHRKIALTTTVSELEHPVAHREEGLGMWQFPFVLPLPQGYDEKTRDFYPPVQNDGYRWAMVVDLDRCIGCNACAAACYAENNLGVVGERRIIEGREMAWLQIQRYEHRERPSRLTFLPMLCQHCDDAPCESVCPVFAPHHNKEGINNQIYNRCIGTRFCSQDCPYKVRRFNFFSWEWPEPLNLQLNPEVTVRSKGVMEKCSFCIQRIKFAHSVAKNEGRKIRDGEVQPACVQTCPTRVFTFGNLMDKESRVWKAVHDKRAYQVMGYLNTKPAVIYLKKVVQDV
jgi:anaerobic selenocysteine-containing dehydrogenase/Fe-S-cluster-containing dehydrogenase component